MLILPCKNNFSHDHLRVFSKLREYFSQVTRKTSKARNIKFGSLSVYQRIIWSSGWCFRFQFWSIDVPSWMFYWNWRIHNLRSKYFTKKSNIYVPFLHIYFQNERLQFGWIQWQNMYGNHMERNEVLSSSNLEYTVILHNLCRIISDNLWYLRKISAWRQIPCQFFGSWQVLFQFLMILRPMSVTWYPYQVPKCPLPVFEFYLELK